MTRVMFQIGLLAFFVSAVIFGTQGLALMDMIARAFIVFVAVVGGQLVVLMVASSMKRPPEPSPEGDQPGQQDVNNGGTAPEAPATQAPATAR